MPLVHKEGRRTNSMRVRSNDKFCVADDGRLSSATRPGSIGNLRTVASARCSRVRLGAISGDSLTGWWKRSIKSIGPAGTSRRRVRPRRVTQGARSVFADAPTSAVAAIASAHEGQASTVPTTGTWCRRTGAAVGIHAARRHRKSARRPTETTIREASTPGSGTARPSSPCSARWCFETSWRE